MHYYQHHIGDFVRDTANLDDHQLATYLRLLWAYYDRETPIAGELEDIAFAMRSDEKTVRLLLRHYFTESPEGWRHARCDREIQAFHERQEKAQKSANARWKNAGALRTHEGGVAVPSDANASKRIKTGGFDTPETCSNDASAMRPHSERNATERVSDANQEPITNNQDKTKTGADKPARFNPRSISLIGVNVALDIAWNEWLDYRIRRSKGMTEKGWRAQADDFVRWSQEGHDVAEMVRTSIKNGWQGLFVPKGSKSPASRQSALEQRNQAAVNQFLSGGADVAG